jgi:hypothetical protein
LPERERISPHRQYALGQYLLDRNWADDWKRLRHETDRTLKWAQATAHALGGDVLALPLMLKAQLQVAEAEKCTTSYLNGLESAKEDLDIAVYRLRRGTQLAELPGALLLRSKVHHALGNSDLSRKDQQEASDIAEHSSMALVKVDAYIWGARLAIHENDISCAKKLYEEATRILNETKYEFQREELTRLSTDLQTFGAGSTYLH